MDEITVRVTKQARRKFLMMYYDCPVSGKRTWRSTKETARSKAERVAGQWETELRQGIYKPTSRVTWEEFVERFYRDKMPTVAKGTRGVFSTVLHAVERILDPLKLAGITADEILRFQGALRKENLRETTIATYTKHLRAALNWAVEVGLLHVAPAVTMPRIDSEDFSKGRPITLEEFERMLLGVRLWFVNLKPDDSPEVVSEKRAAAAEAESPRIDGWVHYLNGLWLSGMRLEESTRFYWDDPTMIHIPNLNKRRPVLKIPARFDKGRKDRTSPLTEDFVTFLRQTPPDDRTGRVFRPIGTRGGILTRKDSVGERIAGFGELAGVVVKHATGKTASAHDLRRSFGFRWAARVMPVGLKALMRHASIDTTMKYYVGQDAERLADDIWDAGRARETESEVAR